MKSKIVITGLCLLTLPLAAWATFTLVVGKQPQKFNVSPAAAVRTEAAKETDTTGKTVAAAKALLATLDDAGRAKVNFAFNCEQKTK